MRLGFILATLSATYIYLTFADLLPGSYVADRGTAAVFSELLVGRLAPWFWMFAVFGGLLPLLLIALPWTRNLRGMVIAATLVVPMMWVKRILMVVGPATYDTMTGSFGRYHPTWVPVAITLAATAAIPLLLMLLFRVVPLLSIDEIEEMQEAENPAATTNQDHRSTEPERHSADLVGATGTAHRVAGAVGVLLLVALLGMFGVGAADPAQAATPQTAVVSLSSDALVSASNGAPKITITGVESGGSVKLSARLTGVDGHPLANADVAFSFSTKEFGTPARLVPLGSVTTDKAGIARLALGGDADHLYRPTAKGPQEFAATYAAKPEAKPVTSSTTINVPVARSAYRPAPAKPLAGVGNIMVVVLFTIVAAIWLTLLAQIWRVRRVCRGIRQPATSTA